MKLKAVVHEDYVNYRKPSMFLSTAVCDFKCCADGGFDPSVCHNHGLVGSPDIEVGAERILSLYQSNPLTSAVVIGGLEPMLQFQEVLGLVETFRENGCVDDIVIFTGYNKDEVSDMVAELSRYQNIVIKFGRYVPNQDPHMDKELGVKLASNNQYAVRIS